MNKAKKSLGKRIFIGIMLGILAVIVVFGIVYAILYSTRSSYDTIDSYTWSKTDEFDISLFPSLTIDEDQDELKIMQLADPQMKFGDFYSRDIKTMSLIEHAIDKEQPDIVVCTGDLTLSVFTHHTYKVLADLMESKQQYWTVTFGNHDSEFDSSKATLVKLLANYEYCLFSAGPTNVKGVSNFLVNIYRGETAKTAGNPSYSLVMIDSNQYPDNRDNKLGEWVYDWIGEDQVEWYEWAIKGLQAIDSDIETSVFCHIPLQESASMYYSHQLSMNKTIPEDIDQSKLLPTRDIYGTVCEGSKDAETLIDPGYEVGIYYQGKNTGLYEAMVELGSSKMLMYGHDHINTLRGYYGESGKEIYLGYGLCSGYHTYPFFDKDNFLLRLFGLSDDPTFNMSLSKDHDGNPLQKGFTNITINLSDTNYGEFDIYNVYASEYFG